MIVMEVKAAAGMGEGGGGGRRAGPAAQPFDRVGVIQPHAYCVLRSHSATRPALPCARTVKCRALVCQCAPAAAAR